MVKFSPYYTDSIIYATRHSIYDDDRDGMIARHEARLRRQKAEVKPEPGKHLVLTSQD